MAFHVRPANVPLMSTIILPYILQSTYGGGVPTHFLNFINNVSAPFLHPDDHEALLARKY
jgi:hypothetical protein